MSALATADGFDEARDSIGDQWDDLDDYMTDLGDATVSDINPEIADRMLRRVLRERRKLAMAEELVAAEKARLDDYLEIQRGRHDTEWLEHCLRTYHETRLAADPKAKTLHLPAGDLVARKSPDRLDVDQAAFEKWAEGRKAGFIVTKVTVDKTAAKKELQHAGDGRLVDPVNGEVIEWATLVIGDVRFSVQTSEDAS